MTLPPLAPMIRPLHAAWSFAQQSSADAGEGAALFVGGGAMVLMLVLVGLLVAFWVWMLIDCVQRRFPGENDKLIWVLLLALTGWIGALIYYFVGRHKGING